MLTQERVKELFDYRIDGYLIRKTSIRNKIQKGDIAGGLHSSGYFRVKIDGKLYLSHRVIFLWHHGYLPELVDHKDRITTHNWIDNLRDSSHQCNVRNRRKLTTNKSGITGISWCTKSGKWQSAIKVMGKSKHLGHFSDFGDAVLSRYKKEVELNWNGCNSTSCSFLYLKERNLLPHLKIKRIQKTIKS